LTSGYGLKQTKIEQRLRIAGEHLYLVVEGL